MRLWCYLLALLLLLYFILIPIISFNIWNGFLSVSKIFPCFLRILFSFGKVLFHWHNKWYYFSRSFVFFRKVSEGILAAFANLLLVYFVLTGMENSFFIFSTFLCLSFCLFLLLGLKIFFSLDLIAEEQSLKDFFTCLIATGSCMKIVSYQFALLNKNLGTTKDGDKDPPKWCKMPFCI